MTDLHAIREHMRFAIASRSLISGRKLGWRLVVTRAELLNTTYDFSVRWLTR